MIGRRGNCRFHNMLHARIKSRRSLKMINKYDSPGIADRSESPACLRTCVRVRKRASVFCQRRALIPSCTPPFRFCLFPFGFLALYRSTYPLLPLSIHTCTYTHMYKRAHARTCVLSTRKSCVYHSTAAFPTSSLPSCPLSIRPMILPYYLQCNVHHTGRGCSH